MWYERYRKEIKMAVPMQFFMLFLICEIKLFCSFLSSQFQEFYETFFFLLFLLFLRSSSNCQKESEKNYNFFCVSQLVAAFLCEISSVLIPIWYSEMCFTRFLTIKNFSNVFHHVFMTPAKLLNFIFVHGRCSKYDIMKFIFQNETKTKIISLML